MSSVTIRDLTSASALSANDLIAVRQGSDTVDKKATAAQMAAFSQAAMTVVDVAAAKIRSGVENDLIFIQSKQGWYRYNPLLTLAADDDLILTTGNGGNTRWELTQSLNRGNQTGWIDRDGATLSQVGDTVVRLTLTSPATFSLQGVRFQLQSGNYDCTLSGTAGTRYLYFSDNTGVLSSQTGFWDFNTQIPVAYCRWNGSAIVGAPQTEFHGLRDHNWHYSHHFESGLGLSSGLVFTGSVQPDSTNNPADDTPTYLWSTTGAVVDEDYYSYPGTLQWLQTLGSGLTSLTAGVFNFLYFNGSTVVAQTAMADRAPFIHAGGNTTPHWNNGGTLEAGVTGDYIAYHYFVAPMVNGWSVFARPHNAKFTSLALAQGARPSSLTWTDFADIKHIYTAVWRVGTTHFTNTTHRAKLVGLYSYRLTPTSVATAFAATDHQALSNRDATGTHPATAIVNTPAGNIAATTVQAAINELDTEKAAVTHTHEGSGIELKLGDRVLGAEATPGNDSYTVLYLRGDETDGATTFVDSSASNHTMSSDSNAITADRISKKYGLGCIKFDGLAGGILSSAASNDWFFSTSDWTIDFWMYYYGGNPDKSLAFTILGSPGTNSNFTFDVNDSGYRYFHYWSGNGLTRYIRGNTVNVMDGSWHHVAFERYGNTIRYYVDGTVIGSGDCTGFNIGDAVTPMRLQFQDCRVDEFRISKGVARYSGASFTPPTAPYGVTTTVEIPCTSAGRALLDDANAAAQRATLGLGTAAVENTTAFAAAAHTHTRTVTFVFDGNGSAISAGANTFTRIPTAATITKVSLLADQTGSAVVDLWVDTYANFPPTVADTITASAKPTLSSAIAYEDATLTGWSKSLSAGAVIKANVDSCSTCTKLVLVLEVTT